MLGNDIVDLRLAKLQSNWKRKGYTDKIFTPEEQLLITLAEKPDVIVWLLWSMKEAAYKIYNRETGLRLFNPLFFRCCLINCNNGYAAGKVNWKNGFYHTQSEINDDFVHTIALKEPLNFKTLKRWHNCCHTDYAMHFNNEMNVYQLYKKQNGLPEIKNTDRKTVHDASVSHHGNYVYVVFRP